MPAVLTHKAIMLLASRRLQEIKEALEVKQLAGATPRTNIETRVQELATKALDILRTDPHPRTDFPGAPYAQPLGKDISTFAVMGAMGPDITAFSAALKPGQGWVFDNVHKGYPDSNREAVVAATCDLTFTFWRKVSAAIAAEVTDPNPDRQRENRERELNKMRAYVLGHLCHLAGDIISHPFINDIEFRFGTRKQGKLEHADGESSHDALTARKILLRDSTRAGASWDAWWPCVKDVPPQFFSAYADALDEVYKTIRSRRAGLVEFEEGLTPLNPPTPIAEFIRDGYHLYRTAIISKVYHYTTFNWFVLLLPLFGPFITFPLLGAGFQVTRPLFVGREEGVSFHQSVAALISMGLALGSFASLFYSIFVATLTMRGAESQTWFGIIANILGAVTGIVSFGLVGELSLTTAERYGAFAVIPTAIALIQLVVWIANAARDGHGRPGSLAMALGLAILAPAIAALLAALLYGLLRAIAAGPLDLGGFLLAAGIWFLLVGALGIVAASKIRDAKIPEKPKSVAEKRQFVRLFDDAAMFRDPTINAAGLANKFFPSGRRKLLKIWWEGPGDLFVRSERFELVFNFVDQSTDTKQVVQSPLAPMTLVEFQAELNRAVRGPGGETGKLKTQRAFSAELDYELPPGGTFSDHGEEENDEIQHNIKAARFEKVGTSPESPYILYHAPKPAQAVRFSPLGPVDTRGKGEDQLRGIAEHTGYPYVFDPLAPDDESVMGYAADFAALLCMGAVEHLEPTPRNEERVFQVFRNWSLDRRRVNEWRMLVAGGAVSEKAGQPGKWDPAMLAHENPDSYNSRLTAPILADAEQATLKHGWVPLLRSWLDVARAPGKSAVDPLPLRPGSPPNLELSRGLAYLLDLPDPA